MKVTLRMAAILGIAAASVASTAAPKFTDPPKEESPAMADLIDKAAAILGMTNSPDQILTDPHYMPAHEVTRFRQAIRDHAKSGILTIVAPDEPGEALTVKVTVRDAAGNPAKGALAYVYQTSAKGWYSDRAPHYATPAGDEKHARLFGYVTCDDAGAFVLRTIHPTGYPGSDLPAHIHVEVTSSRGGQTPLITEIRFDDDPRMTDAMKAASSKEGFVIVHVAPAAAGGLSATADLSLR